MARKTGLGRGLNALIPSREEFTAEETAVPSSGISLIDAKRISPNPRQPRMRIDPGEIEELATSIREHGLIQPLIVTQGPHPGEYILIAGERRLIASRQAGLKQVPAVIREASERELVELALVENVQRADLNPLEAAEAYRQLSEEFGLSHEDISTRVGKSRVSITNTLRLLKLPVAVRQALAENSISEGQARALLALSNPHAQTAALQTILSKGLTVRQTEELVRKLSDQQPPTGLKSPPSPEIGALEERLRAQLGTKVTLNHRRNTGTLVIHYYSEEELNTLVELILGPEQ